MVCVRRWIRVAIMKEAIAKMSDAILELKNLSISFGEKRAVEQLHLSMQRGERLALVGESGSGKTVTALSILRLLEQAKLEGEIRFNGENLLQKSEQELRAIRGADISMIFQEPMSALNPLYTIGNQIMESLQLHEQLDKHQARARTIELLESTGVREAERRVDSYPHQLSGGQRQRAMIAMALACRPQLIIADEPTTALDVSIRARIIDNLSVLLITHDLLLVRKFATRVAVMEKGRLVEVADTETLFSNPQHPYTQKLLNSHPVRAVAPVAGDAQELLAADQIRVEYKKVRPGFRARFRPEALAAVDGADVSLRQGETLGVLGESGSGKSTLAMALLGLIRPAAGGIAYRGEALKYASKQWRNLRARIQVVFQDPFGSLSPRKTIRQIVEEGLRLHRPELSEHQRLARVIEVLGEVGLPETALHRYPHQFSGGQRQRIAIARALVIEPEIIVLDEPTSALDVSIQFQVLELLTNLQKKYGLSYVLITHDIAVVRALSHRIMVMKDGKVLETGETLSLLAAPQHPYTQSLIQASL
jgi:microcin C transport system ATP-binding protein